MRIPRDLEIRSVPPPGEKGTMIFKGLSGKAANAGVATTAAMVSTVARNAPNRVNVE